MLKRCKKLSAGHAFIIADYTTKSLSKSTVQVVSAARKFADKITIGVFGSDSSDVATAASNITGVSSVVLVQGDTFKSPVADSLAVAVKDQAARVNATHIMGSTSSLVKDTLPRVAALLDVQPISDVINVESDSKFKRPMYAGNVIATVESRDTIKVLTIRPTAFPVDEGSSSAIGSPAPIVLVDQRAIPSSIEFLSRESKKNDKPELSSASVVVSGGRGLKSREKFDSILNPLAEKLHAAVGASRAAVDAGFAANDLQVGQTGKVVAPNLYIAVGISGAIQHLAGMKDSRTIVAINKDADAPIFQVADYGIVGDLFTLVPELTKKL